MTPNNVADNVVTDEQLGKLYRQQTDILRRVRKGTLPFPYVIKGLQLIAEGKFADKQEFPFLPMSEYTLYIPEGFTLDTFVETYGNFAGNKASIYVKESLCAKPYPAGCRSVTAHIVRVLWPVSVWDCLKYVKSKGGIASGSHGLALALFQIESKLPRDGNIMGIDDPKNLPVDRGHRLVSNLTWDQEESRWRFWSKAIDRYGANVDVLKDEYFLYLQLS